MAWRRYSLLVHLAVFISFAMITAAMTWPLVKAPDRLSADVGVNDPMLNARFLKNTLEWMRGNRDGPFDADIFFPHPDALATTDPALGNALLALPFAPFTRNYLALIHLAILLTFPLTAFGTYLLSREITGSGAAGFFAGIAFAFSFMRIGHIDHSNVSHIQWLPFTLYFLYRLKESPTLPSAAGFSVFFFLNGVGSSNIALYTTPAIAAVAAWLVFSVPGPRRPRFLLMLSAATAASSAALLPFFLPFFRAAEMFGISMRRTAEEAQIHSATIEQLYGAPPWSLLYGKHLSKHMAFGRESAAFLGVVVLILCIIAFMPRRRADGILSRRPVRFLVGVLSFAAYIGALYAGVLSHAAAIIAVASVLGYCVFRHVARLRGMRACEPETGSAPGLPPDPGRPADARAFLVIGTVYLLFCFGPRVLHAGRDLGPGLWTWLMDIPGFAAVRTPSRFYLVTCLCASIIASIGAGRVFHALNNPLRLVAIALVPTLLLAEMWVAPIPTRRFPLPSEAPQEYQWLSRQPGKGAVLDLPFFGPHARHRMYHAMIHDHPTVDAESSFLPPVIGWVWADRFRDGTAAVSLERLAAAGLAFVVLRGGDMAAEMLATHEKVLSSSGATPAVSFGPTRIWRLHKPEKVDPFGAATVSASIQPPSKVKADGPIVAHALFASRTGNPAFSPGDHRFTLKLVAKDGQQSGGQPETLHTTVHLVPPIIPSRTPLVEKATFGRSLKRASYAVIYTLSDEHGTEWARTEGALVVE